MSSTGDEMHPPPPFGPVQDHRDPVPMLQPSSLSQGVVGEPPPEFGQTAQNSSAASCTPSAGSDATVTNSWHPPSAGVVPVSGDPWQSFQEGSSVSSTGSHVAPFGVVTSVGFHGQQSNPSVWNNATGSVLYQQQHGQQQFGWQGPPAMSSSHLMSHHQALPSHASLVSPWYGSHNSPNSSLEQAPVSGTVSPPVSGQVGLISGHQRPLVSSSPSEHPQHMPANGHTMSGSMAPGMEQDQQSVQEQVAYGTGASYAPQSTMPLWPKGAVVSYGETGSFPSHLQTGAVFQPTSPAGAGGGESPVLPNPETVQPAPEPNPEEEDDPLQSDSFDSWAMALGAALGTDPQLGHLTTLGKYGVILSIALDSQMIFEPVMVDFGNVRTLGAFARKVRERNETQRASGQAKTEDGEAQRYVEGGMETPTQGEEYVPQGYDFSRERRAVFSTRTHQPSQDWRNAEGANNTALNPQQRAHMCKLAAIERAALSCAPCNDGALDGKGSVKGLSTIQTQELARLRAIDARGRNLIQDSSERGYETQEMKSGVEETVGGNVEDVADCTTGNWGGSITNADFGATAGEEDTEPSAVEGSSNCVVGSGATWSGGAADDDVENVGVMRTLMVSNFGDTPVILKEIRLMPKDDPGTPAPFTVEVGSAVDVVLEEEASEACRDLLCKQCKRRYQLNPGSHVSLDVLFNRQEKAGFCGKWLTLSLSRMEPSLSSTPRQNLVDRVERTFVLGTRLLAQAVDRGAAAALNVEAKKFLPLSHREWFDRPVKGVLSIPRANNPFYLAQLRVLDPLDYQVPQPVVHRFNA